MHYSDLPHEILEQIFLIPSIEKRDLLQLQLTCKQWSPVAQKYLYQEIKIAEDRGPLYGRRSLAFLIRSLRANRQLGKCIKSFDFGSLFPDGMYGIPIRDLSFSITTLAYLCPNLVILKNKSSDSTKYLETLANLHRQGFLQRLEFISIPNMTSNSNVATYNATILEFKDTIRSVTFVDGGYDIRPTYLQLFTSAEHLCLLYFSRVHLYQIKDCVSNCGPRVKSVSVTTHKLYMISLQDEYNDPFAVQPHRTVEELTICQHGITTNELAFIMRMFPLLKRVSLDSLILDKISFNQSDMQVITQFFGYLSQMTKVRCGFRWHDISNGLELLPHLAKSLGIKELSITGLNKRGTHSKISILLRNPPNVLRCTLNESTARSKTKGLSATIEICSTEAQAFFGEALESLKSDSIESITITHLGYTLEVEQHLVDYIVNHYKGLQDLTFDHVKFRWNARLSAVRATVATSQKMTLQGFLGNSSKSTISNFPLINGAAFPM
ncbi:hypothetical protein MBANPS3_005555 [Mucor bainieri]